MSAPRLLDLFSGAGGAGMGYMRAGFEVVGVDLAPQPNYPFRIIQGDALDFLAKHGQEYDAIHASPPCQSFTAYRRKGYGVGDGYLNLIPQARELLHALNVPWIIENVQGAPLESAVRYCGSSFRLDVRRHRFFESNVRLSAPSCDHSWQTPRFAPATNRTNLRRTVEVGVWRIPLAVQQAAMGVDWTTLSELSEAIPPAYTEHIGTPAPRRPPAGPRRLTPSRRSSRCSPPEHPRRGGRPQRPRHSSAAVGITEYTSAGPRAGEVRGSAGDQT